MVTSITPAMIANADRQIGTIDSQIDAARQRLEDDKGQLTTISETRLNLDREEAELRNNLDQVLENLRKARLASAIAQNTEAAAARSEQVQQLEDVLKHTQEALTLHEVKSRQEKEHLDEQERATNAAIEDGQSKIARLEGERNEMEALRAKRDAELSERIYREESEKLLRLIEQQKSAQQALEASQKALDDVGPRHTSMPLGAR